MTPNRKAHVLEPISATAPPETLAPEPALAGFHEICSIRIGRLHTNPLIWHHVEVPTSIKLKVLHDIVQIAVGWLDCHLSELTVDRRTTAAGTSELACNLAPRRHQGPPA